uniref:Uncharacterized protein n=1 Tax=Arundo donax TaxID=35708 RepID=A0A0A8YHC5_ARUDO
MESITRRKANWNKDLISLAKDKFVKVNIAKGRSSISLWRPQGQWRSPRPPPSTTARTADSASQSPSTRKRTPRSACRPQELLTVLTIGVGRPLAGDRRRNPLFFVYVFFPCYSRRTHREGSKTRMKAVWAALPWQGARTGAGGGTSSVWPRRRRRRAGGRGVASAGGRNDGGCGSEETAAALRRAHRRLPSPQPLADAMATEISWPLGSSRANGTSTPWIHRRLFIPGSPPHSSSPAVPEPPPRLPAAEREGEKETGERQLFGRAT